MSDYVSHPYRGQADLPPLIALAQASRHTTITAYYHPGDFVWQLYLFDGTDDVRLWMDGARAVACAIFEPPLTFQFVIDPAVIDQGSLTSEILEWAEGRRAIVERKDDIALAYQELGTNTLSTSVLESDPQRGDLLTNAGYVRRQPSGVRYARVLETPLPEIVLPSGANFRTMTDSDIEARAELHRDAWSVWGQSAHSAARYRRLRLAPLYDPQLDVVLEHEGRLVSLCVCWLDTANSVGYFEPVGTRPSTAGQGFGRAVMHEGMRRLSERGMRLATVSTATVNKPAQALYPSAGFDVVDTEHFFVRSDATTV